MKRFWLIIIAIIILVSGVLIFLNYRKEKETSLIVPGGGKMNLTSSNFPNGGNLPAKYSCDGEDVAPNLTWSNVPSETKSFALIMEDPDAPRGTFIHWLVVNIPVTTLSVSEGSRAIPGATALINDFGKTEYGGPCPPSGTHRYYFKLYALDIEKLNGVTKDNFYEKIKPHIIDQAELMGRYQR